MEFKKEIINNHSVYVAKIEGKEYEFCLDDETMVRLINSGKPNIVTDLSESLVGVRNGSIPVQYGYVQDIQDIEQGDEPSEEMRISEYQDGCSLCIKIDGIGPLYFNQRTSPSNDLNHVDMDTIRQMIEASQRASMQRIMDLEETVASQRDTLREANERLENISETCSTLQPTIDGINRKISSTNQRLDGRIQTLTNDTKQRLDRHSKKIKARKKK